MEQYKRKTSHEYWDMFQICGHSVSCDYPSYSCAQLIQLSSINYINFEVRQFKLYLSMTFLEKDDKYFKKQNTKHRNEIKDEIKYLKKVKKEIINNWSKMNYIDKVDLEKIDKDFLSN